MSQIYQKAFSNLFRLGLTLIVTMGFGLVLRVILPRVFGVETMGLFYLAESLSYITFTFLSLGVHAYVHRHVPGQPDEAKRIFRSIIQFKFFYGFLLISGLCVYLFLMDYPESTIQIVLIFSLNHFLQTLTSDIMKPFLLALEKVNLVSKIEILSKFIQVVAVCGVLLFWKQLEIVLWAYTISSVVPFLIILIYAGRQGWLATKFQFSTYRSIVKASLPFFVNGAVITLYSNIDITILGEIGNQIEVGLYGAAQKLKGVLLMIVPLLSSAIVPLLSRSLKENYKLYEEFLCRLYHLLVILSFPATFIMILFAKEIVLMLYGHEFEKSAQILIILTPVVVFTYINVFLSMNLTLVSNGRMLTTLTIVTVGVNAILNLILIPYGLRVQPVGGGGVVASLTTLLAEFMNYVGLLFLTPTKILTGRILRETILIIVPIGVLVYYNQQILDLSLQDRIILAFIFLLYPLITRMIRIHEILSMIRLIRTNLK